jgi:hypothetical protein
MRHWSSLKATMLLCALLLVIQPIGFAGEAAAQVQRPSEPDNRLRKIDPELRVDVIGARVSALHAGVGVSTVTGTYLRTGIIGALGFSRDGLSGRVDGLTRFHFDPFRQSRWAPYGGGGISGRFDRREKPRAYLLLLFGMDGPVKRGWTASFEAGLGGGARIGAIIRRATAERR